MGSIDADVSGAIASHSVEANRLSTSENNPNGVNDAGDIAE